MKKSSNNERVERICTTLTQHRLTWFDRLGKDDQQLCLEVRSYVIKNAVSLTPVAKNLIAELKLNVSAKAVVDWLRKGREQ